MDIKNKADIETLIDNSEKESLFLEYKQEITSGEHSKKEILKDISAFANAEGGHLIIGIKEKDGRAIGISGTTKNISNQPIEEWIENILISNIRPKLTAVFKVIDIKTDPNKVVIVIDIPHSSQRPHMVIAGGRNAYYIRRNYQSTYADEHEIRLMHIETMGKEMKVFMEKSEEATPDKILTDSVIRSSSMQLYWYSSTDRKRYVFPTLEIFRSWFPKDESQPLMQEIPDYLISKIPLGGNVTYRPGTRLLKITGSANVYAVANNGVLRRITTGEAAENIFGSDWPSILEVIPDPYVVNYSMGENINKLGDYDPKQEKVTSKLP